MSLPEPARRVITVLMFSFTVSLVLAIFTAATVQAQDYPARPIRLIAPYPPGGSVDPTARVFAAYLTDKLGQQIVVDNRPGAGATIGHALGAKATPDGYTLLFGTSGGLVTGPLFNANVAYDSLKDFAPIAVIASNPFLLITFPGLPATNFKSFIDQAKMQPGKIIFASPGVGTPNHLGVELLNVMTGAKFVHVPYKGGGPAMVDLLSGRAHATFSGVPQCIEFVRNGRVKVIATGHATRIRAVPDAVPISETLPGFNNTTWYGVLAPAGTPKAIINKLNGEFARAYGDAEFNKRLIDLGVEPETSTPAGLYERIRNERERWRKVIQDAGITTGG